MKSFYISAIVLLSVIISCSSDPGDPVAVTKEFIAVTNESRFADARKMATANYQSVIDQLEKNITAMSKEDREKLEQNILLHSQKYEIKTKTADSAEVIVFSETSPISIIFTLKNVDGKWKIDRQDENY